MQTGLQRHLAAAITTAAILLSARGLFGQLPPQSGPPAWYPQSERTVPVSLPTDRSLRADGPDSTLDRLPLISAEPPASGGYLSYGKPGAGPPADLAKLLRPRFNLAAEWEPESSGLSIGSVDVSARMPTYPILPGPPPFIISGFSYTIFDAPVVYDLPRDLYDISLGFNWMRPINEVWILNFMGSAAFASDFQNDSSDAWQFRGGVFALCRRSEQWQFVLGAFATGRRDIPVLPAIGAVWSPTPALRVDLKMPQPKVMWLVADSGHRQHWLLVGGGISGGTWGYQRASGVDELLTYREWRLVLGWESTPPRKPGEFLVNGPKFGAEVGWVFGRAFEFETAAPDLKPSDALLLRATTSF